MAWDRSRYPSNWLEIVARVRARAGDCCEAVRADGARCTVAHLAYVHRCLENAEHWELCAAYVDGEYQWCTGRDVDESRWALREVPVRIVLTTAHTCACESPCGEPDHLRSLCQLHHLRLDARLHARHAAETRRAKRRRAGQLTLAGVD